MVKKYKPGQFCSLGGALYRVKRVVSGKLMFFTCAACKYKCYGNDQLFRDCVEKLPPSCYPTKVKPKKHLPLKLKHQI